MDNCTAIHDLAGPVAHEIAHEITLSGGRQSFMRPTDAYAVSSMAQGLHQGIARTRDLHDLMPDGPLDENGPRFRGARSETDATQ